MIKIQIHFLLRLLTLAKKIQQEEREERERTKENNKKHLEKDKL